MENLLYTYLLSVIEQDTAPVVICNLNHIVLFMNKEATARYGNLVNKSIFDCHNEKSADMIKRTVEYFAADTNNNKVYENYNQSENKDVYMVALRDENSELIGYYEKHEFRNKETSKVFDI